MDLVEKLSDVEYYLPKTKINKRPFSYRGALLVKFHTRRMSEGKIVRVDCFYLHKNWIIVRNVNHLQKVDNKHTKTTFCNK